MSSDSRKPLDPITFLQAFIAESVRVTTAAGDGSGTQEYVERVGLAASQCLEEGARSCLGYSGSGPITPDQYASLIVTLKNQIGGNFARTSSEPGVIRVRNSCCPFGDNVRAAPELCRMTASVFGGIAARNFGYGKVELRKRIATHDDCCEVYVYIDPATAENKPGDEYHCDGDKIVSRSASTTVRARVEAKLREVWCPAIPGGARPAHPAPAVIAESAAMRNVLEAVEVVAPTRATVLISGETGVGKEVIARAIHAMSDRTGRELLAVNCGAIPENLIESTLFGHEKGAFTDAYDVHHGYFERTNGGTLFLDEIDCLPVSAQARLLRVLQEGQFERVGGRQTLATDVRIVAASNQDLERAVAEGRFRRDLFYRLNVVPIQIPPLRERPDDLSPLVHHFMGRLAEQYATAPKTFNNRAWSKLLRYDWPGNLRELENVLERAFLFARGVVIDDLKIDAPTAYAHAPANLRDARRQALRETEANLIVAALRKFNGNVTAVAREMSVTPRAVHMKLKSLGINAAAFRPPHANSATRVP